MYFEFVKTTVDKVEGKGNDAASVVTSLRLLRLLRLTRMFRVVPKLLVLLKGIAAAIFPMFYTLLLLLVFLYAFGVFFAMRTRGRGIVATVSPDVNVLFGS